jgi:Tol biopolymer transport system component
MGASSFLCFLLIQSLAVTPVTTENFVVGDLALSTDGTRLAYTLAGPPQSGKMDLWIRDTGTLRGEKLAPPARFGESMVFAPDGKSLYFLVREPAKPWTSDLYQWPLSGGEPRKVVDRLDGPVSFSADGKQVALGRNIGHNVGDLIVRNVATGAERRIGAVHPAWQSYRVAWSPDGQEIACPSRDRELAFVSVQTGEVKKVAAPEQITALTWPTGGALFAMLNKRPQGQIWRYDVAGNTWEALSSKSDNYAISWLAAAPGGSTLAAVRLEDMMPVVSWIGNFFGRPGNFVNYSNVVLIHPRR